MLQSTSVAGAYRTRTCPAPLMILPAIRFDITHCAACGDAAYMRCRGCSGILETWYCNKFCQRTHWTHHKLECKSACLYDKIRVLSWPSDAQQIKNAEDELNLSVDAVTRQYLAHVPVAARPKTMDGNTVLKREVTEMIKLLADTTTMREHNDTITAKYEMLEQSFRDKYDFEVPFAIRPVVSHEDGDCGIQLFMHDYEYLSLKVFGECFADGKKTTTNPWTAKK